MGNYIRIGFLRQRYDIARFLSHHVRVAEQLGRSRQSERSFIGATASRQGSFTQTVSRLRGSQGLRRTQSVLKTGTRRNAAISFQTPGSVPIHRTLGQIVPSARGTSASGEYLGIEAGSFLGRNPALIKLVHADPELREAFGQDLADGDIDVETAIARAASRRLGANSPINREFLTTHTDEALVIALNVGGIADILREDDELAGTFTRSARAAGEYAVTKRVAAEAAGLFDEGSKITQELLDKNPRTAMHLLMNPQRARSLNRDKREAAEFVSHMSAFEEGLEGTIVNKAVSIMSNRAVFNQAFMAKNPGFAEFVVGDYLTAEGESLAAFLNNRISSTSQNPNVGRIVAERQARVASNRMPAGFPLDEGFFLDNPGIAALVNASDTFASALSAERSTIERFMESVNGYYPHRNGTVQKALRAFEAGYVYRPGVAFDATA